MHLATFLILTFDSRRKKLINDYAFKCGIDIIYSDDKFKEKDSIFGFPTNNIIPLK